MLSIIYCTGGGQRYLDTPSQMYAKYPKNIQKYPLHFYVQMIICISCEIFRPCAILVILHMMQNTNLHVQNTNLHVQNTNLHVPNTN